MPRHLSPEEAEELKPGSDNYRAYVGPPRRFGLLTLSQMSLLAALGLEETDYVLDFGCGSLRLGRSLIPFLREGRYFGVDPNLWLIDDGFKYETGEGLKALKSPQFSGSDTFDCTVFDREFDFIMAQSIITHAGADNTRKLIESAGRAMKQDGILMLSYLKGEADTPLPDEPWTYPFNVPYPENWLQQTCADAGLIWRELDWHHAGATWAAVVRDERRLPLDDHRLGYRGVAAPRWRAE